MEVARQLTLVEQRMFLAIRPPRDMVAVATEKSRPVQAFIAWTNTVRWSLMAAAAAAGTDECTAANGLCGRRSGAIGQHQAARHGAEEDDLYCRCKPWDALLDRRVADCCTGVPTAKQPELYRVDRARAGQPTGVAPAQHVEGEYCSAAAAVWLKSDGVAPRVWARRRSLSGSSCVTFAPC